ncbi:hypothetical protein C8Q72DRAFT_852665 [Fomitopsis betulina]|nr:hypothetical protein C8Q72DRAFT_852665 [Fomitopsis betulina]
MVSLSISRSPSPVSSPSQNGFRHELPSPSDSNFTSTSSSSSSSSSSTKRDDEDMTIIASRSLVKLESNGHSNENLHLLALSSRITELSYTISDIQTRIFEIQELRHKSQSSADSKDATNVIDQSLSSLDERLDNISAGIKSVNDTLEPLLKAGDRTSIVSVPSDETILLRKHSAMLSEWEALQKEIQVLREELKEDKWLTVFRTVTDQADGMMSSLEKAVNRCQEFIWKVQTSLMDAGTPSTSSVRSERSHISYGYDTFQALLDSFEAKKKHYMPATTKVLSIIDKGVQDRVTKNGECLRRHAESTQRWRTLRERIARTDADMEQVRRVLTGEDLSAASSEAGSSTSAGTTSKSRKKNGFLKTPPVERPPKHRAHSNNALSRSISPFRKLAQRLTRVGSSKSPPRAMTPLTPASPKRVPSSEPGRTLRHRASMLHFMGGGTQPATPVTPSHKYSHSMTPDSSPSAKRIDRMELNSTTLKNKPAWNSSTKVYEAESGTLKSSPRRPSISSSVYRGSDDIPPVPPMYNRSASRSSMSSSRPWSPVTSSVSTTHSSTPFSNFYRPPSRTNTPGLPVSYRPPSRSQVQTPGANMEPRCRPKTPSYIPAPSKSWRSVSGSPPDTSRDSDDSLMQRAFTPGPRSHTPGGSTLPARPPSRSMIPIPSVNVLSASRPGTSMDSFRPDSSMSFRTSADGARTPDILKGLRTTPRLSMPPSSFRESASPRTPSRPPTRSGAATPGGDGVPAYEYVPTNPRDPLDMEIANVVNSLAHCLVIKRSDPPLRGTPKENEEIRAQYSFTGPLTSKLVTCKLTTLARPGASGKTKRVMCRVGGGWQDLRMYVLSRQT